MSILVEGIPFHLVCLLKLTYPSMQATWTNVTAECKQ